jgi:hypothetical protein
MRAEGPPSRKKRGKGGATLFWDFTILGNTGNAWDVPIL